MKPSKRSAHHSALTGATRKPLFIITIVPVIIVVSSFGEKCIPSALWSTAKLHFSFMIDWVVWPSFCVLPKWPLPGKNALWWILGDRLF